MTNDNTSGIVLSLQLPSKKEFKAKLEEVKEKVTEGEELHEVEVIFEEENLKLTYNNLLFRLGLLAEEKSK